MTPEIGNNSSTNHGEIITIPEEIKFQIMKNLGTLVAEIRPRELPEKEVPGVDAGSTNL
jgi:hypothetical protein